MEDKSTKHKSHRSRRVILTVLTLILLVLVVSYGLRSNLYLKARLTPKLAEVGLSVNGEFSFKDIRAIGLTGLVLTDVVFTPNSQNTKPIHMDYVTVYPDLLGMFIGDLNASLVEISSLKAQFNFSDEHSPDIQWLKSISGNLDQNSLSNIATHANGPQSDHPIPPLKCINCNFELTLSSTQTVKLHAQEQSAEIADKKQIYLSGEPFNACLKDASGETCFTMSLGAVQAGDSILISRAQLSDLNWKGVTLSTLSINGIEFGRNDQRNVLLVENGHIDVHITDESPLDILSGSYIFEFNQLEILHERVAKRLGLGIQIREPSGAKAKIFGGYSAVENKLALTLDTAHFDIARFAQKADFKDQLRLDKFPITGNSNLIIEFDRQRAWLDMDAGVADGSLFAPVIARDPLSEINAKSALKAYVDLQNKIFDIESANTEIGEFSLDFKLSREQTAENSYQVDASVHSKGDSSKFISSIPKGFAPAIMGYRLAGDYEFKLTLSYDEANVEALTLGTEFNLDSVQTEAFDPNSDFSALKESTFQVKVNAASVPLTIGPKEPTWVSFYDLPRETAYTFVASEDGKFFSHPGFDIRAIRASLIADLKADKVVRGGSTISQQVVKNLFLNHDKTASRKFQEAFLTWQMEKTLTKLRIFELYLNLAHLAKDTYGIRAAAEYYFQKPVQQLTLRESLFLASILPNPVIFGGQYIQGNLSSSRLNKMQNIGAALLRAKRISQSQWDEALPLIKEGKISDRPKPSPKP